jgi:hypothetical protein
MSQAVANDYSNTRRPLHLEPCWTCLDDSPGGGGCDLAGSYARFGASGRVSRASTKVSVPGGGPYKLVHRLQNGGGPTNDWQAIIGSVDGSFSDITVESMNNSDAFDWTCSERPFLLPSTTTSVTLTLGARHVSRKLTFKQVKQVFRDYAIIYL